VEILLLSGGTPYANFKNLSHAWGRERNFHQTLVNAVCERRGEVERKRRSDAGKRLSAAAKEAFRQKLKRSRQTTQEIAARMHVSMDGTIKEDDSKPMAM
jgi:uncharacterized membrane protein